MAKINLDVLNEVRESEMKMEENFKKVEQKGLSAGNAGYKEPADKDAFDRGYYCAITNFMMLFDEPTMAEELFNQNYCGEKRLVSLGIDESDIVMLKKLISELKRREKR